MYLLFVRNEATNNDNDDDFPHSWRPFSVENPNLLSPLAWSGFLIHLFVRGTRSALTSFIYLYSSRVSRWKIVEILDPIHIPTELQISSGTRRRGATREFARYLLQNVHFFAEKKKRKKGEGKN